MVTSGTRPNLPPGSPVARLAAARQRSRSSAATIAFACAAMLVAYLPFSAANGALGTIATVTGATTGQLQWVSDAFLTLALAAVALVAFVVVERRSASPLLHPQLFASSGFNAAGFAAAAVLFTVGGCLFVLSLFFTHQHVGGLGIALGPAVLGSVLAARLRAGTGYAAAVHVCAGTLAAVFAITAIAAAILLTREASA